MEEKVKFLSEIEGKEYLLKIQEEKTNELEKRIKKYENFLAICTVTIFPLALMGLLYLVENIDIKFTIVMIVVTIIGVSLLLLFGFIVQKIQNR